MTVSTFFTSGADGRILSTDATYSHARAGTGASVVVQAVSAGSFVNVIGRLLSTAPDPDEYYECGDSPNDPTLVVTHEAGGAPVASRRTLLGVGT